LPLRDLTLFLPVDVTANADRQPHVRVTRLEDIAGLRIARAVLNLGRFPRAPEPVEWLIMGEA
jgi:hypothetical protein